MKNNHTQHSMEEEKQLFDEWYKEQKEMTPYIMRDYFLSRINLAVSKERERIVEEIKQNYCDVVELPENAKEFMGDWERGVCTGAITLKNGIINLINTK